MPHKLLLADDSVTIQRMIELTFADEDIQVVAVSDGEQAIARIDADPPDIVLADIGMPKKTGYEVAAHVKSSPRLAHIPVVLLTGAFEPVDKAKADAAKTDGVLAKPFEPQAVISRVKELLNRASGAPASGAAAPQAAAEPPAIEISRTPQPIGAPIEEQTSMTALGSDAATLDSYFDKLDQAFANLDGGGNGAAAASEADKLSVADQIDWFANKMSQPASAAPPPDLPLSYASPQPDVPAAVDPFAAFSTSPSAPAAASSPAVFEVQTFEAVAPQPIAAQPAAPPPVVEAPKPAPTPAPVAAQPRPAPAPVARPAAASVAVATPPAPVPAAPASQGSGLGDAFAALLVAEQNPSAAPTWPAAVPTASQPAPMPPAAALNAPLVIDEAVIEKIVAIVLARLSDQVVRDAVASRVSEIAESLVREEIERIKASIQ